MCGKNNAMSNYAHNRFEKLDGSFSGNSELYLLNGNSHSLKQRHRGPLSVFIQVIDLFDVPKVDEALGAHLTRKMSHENNFFYGSRGVTVNHSVFFGVQAPTIPLFRTIALIRKTGSVSIVSNSENLSIVRACDHGSHFEPRAGGPL